MQNDDTSIKRISEYMYEDETVLWAGKPEGVRLLEVPYGTTTIIRWIICLIIAVAALWYGLIFVPSSASANLNGNTIMVVCIIIAIVIALWPMLDIYRLKKKCSYYITNQRALTFVAGSSAKLKEMLYTDGLEITFDLIEGNRGNIYIGKKLKNSFKKARVSVFTPSADVDEEPRPLVFYSVMDPGDIVSKFPSM